MPAVKNETNLARWGNSQATRIPQWVIKQLKLSNEQRLEVSVVNGSIILTPLHKQPTNIHELFAGWEDDGHRDSEPDWGPAQGKEIQW